MDSLSKRTTAHHTGYSGIALCYAEFMASNAVPLLATFLAGAVIGTSVALLLADGPVPSTVALPTQAEHDTDSRTKGGTTPPAPAETETAEKASFTGEWLDEPGALEEENQALRRQLDDLLVWIQENLPSEAPAKPNSLAAHNLPLMSTNGLLSDAVAERLTLDPAARIQVDTAIANAAQALDALLSSNTVIRQRGGHGVSVKIPPSKEGEAIRTGLLADLRKTMGQDRYADFAAAWGAQLERELRYFGTASQSINFRLVRKGGEPTKLAVSDRMHINEGNGRHTSHHQHSNYSEIPEKYREFIEWPTDEQP